MNSLDNMKQLIETVSQLDQPKKTGMLKENYRYPTDYTYSELAKLISDYVIDNELDLDFDDLQSVADELNATLHYDRLDSGDPEGELNADHIESVLPEVHQYLMGEIEATDPETAPDHAQRLIATAEKIAQYPGVTTEDMLVPREYDFDGDSEEIEEADLNNGYGQHHKVDGEDLFPNGDDGPIQKKIPSRADNRLGRDKTVSVDLVKEHLERFERMYKGYMKK